MKLDGKQLVDARNRRGLTQVQMAREIGVATITLNRAEKGYGVRPSIGVHICKALRLKLADVVLSVKETEGPNAA